MSSRESTFGCLLPKTMDDVYIEAPATIIDYTASKKSTGLLALYWIFPATMFLVALFFLASLSLAVGWHYFLDWPSALVGLLGTAGLALVGLFSRFQLRSSK